MITYPPTTCSNTFSKKEEIKLFDTLHVTPDSSLLTPDIRHAKRHFFVHKHGLRQQYFTQKCVLLDYLPRYKGNLYSQSQKVSNSDIPHFLDKNSVKFCKYFLPKIGFFTPTLLAFRKFLHLCLTCDAWWGVNILSQFQLPSSNVLDSQCIEDYEQKGH